MIGFIRSWFCKRKAQRAVNKMFEAAYRHFSFSEEDIKRINEDFDARINKNALLIDTSRKSINA